MVNRFARPTPATPARYRSERDALLAQARANGRRCHTTGDAPHRHTVP